MTDQPTIQLRLTPQQAQALRRLLHDHMYAYHGAATRGPLLSIEHRLTGALADLQS